MILYCPDDIGHENVLSLGNCLSYFYQNNIPEFAQLLEHMMERELEISLEVAIHTMKSIRSVSPMFANIEEAYCNLRVHSMPKSKTICFFKLYHLINSECEQ
jgi:hypothetical protein